MQGNDGAYTLINMHMLQTSNTYINPYNMYKKLICMIEHSRQTTKITCMYKFVIKLVEIAIILSSADVLLCINIHKTYQNVPCCFCQLLQLE